MVKKNSEFGAEFVLVLKALKAVSRNGVFLTLINPQNTQSTVFIGTTKKKSPSNTGNSSELLLITFLQIWRKLLTITGYLPKCLVQQTESKLWQVAW